VVARVAMAGLVLIFAAGAWLIAAPFVLRFQPSGAAWTGAARMDLGIGVVLVIAGFAGFFIALAGRVSELYADAEQRESR